MADLSTRFFGLKLDNPIIIASSGLTANAESIKRFAKCGAGAIVLKSIFEEEIKQEYDQVLRNAGTSHHFLEQLDYFDYEIREENVGHYIDLIKEVRKEVKVPIIASINCITAGEWSFFAEKIEAAGADALELNLFLLPSDIRKSAEDQNEFYMSAVEHVMQKVKIPVAVKISPFFSNLGAVIQALSEKGVAGISLFNRFYTPDIDLEQMKLIPSSPFSEAVDYTLPLRWIGLMSDSINCDLAATTGIHDGATVAKMLLAGASAVQMASVFYKKGPEHIGTILNDLTVWMNEKGYQT
ncbi:MAG: dihydroorotate dehydrogenase-like protein, partial [Bacteroidota bacterium]|nr:dihydroorotate dehydrogenase-like protein [Bacteroidota bacterium]